jgi:DNA invertase Pin-like site-specific DNA recombinase
MPTPPKLSTFPPFETAFPPQHQEARAFETRPTYATFTSVETLTRLHNALVARVEALEARSGSRNVRPSALAPEQVAEVRRLAALGVPQSRLAKDFNVSRPTIARALT